MNKILFLYTDPAEKSELTLASEILRAVFRKFRKNAEISLFNIDLSPTCRDKVKKLVCEKVSSAEGVMFCGKKNCTDEEIALFSDCFGIHSFQYFSSGKSILFPIVLRSSLLKEGIIEESLKTDISAIEKTVNLAINAAMKKKELLLCTDSEKEADRMIYNEFLNSMGNAQNINSEHLDFNEMIPVLATKSPSADTILTTRDNARIIALHINALNKFPAGYSVYHADAVRIYTKESIPFPQFSNLSYAGLLIALGSMLENELGYRNIGFHLRKSVSQTLEKCCYESSSDFQKHLFIEITKPIRHRKVKTYEGDN